MAKRSMADLMQPGQATVSTAFALVTQREGRPIASKDLLAMFEIAGVDRVALYAALCEMGREYLPKELKGFWSPKNPTRNYCYVIAEFVLRYFAPDGSHSRSLIVGDPETPGYKHYFIVWPDNRIVDLAAEQFSDYTLVRYDQARRQPFRTPTASKRTQTLYKLYQQALRRSLHDKGLNGRH